MHEIFERRATRIETAKLGSHWEEAAAENRQVHATIEDLGWKDICG
ncbi:MAG: hypothetical protein AAGA96_12875 [Verrucomicrobiota bacterium]